MDTIIAERRASRANVRRLICVHKLQIASRNASILNTNQRVAPLTLYVRAPHVIHYPIINQRTFYESNPEEKTIRRFKARARSFFPNKSRIQPHFPLARRLARTLNIVTTFDHVHTNKNRTIHLPYSSATRPPTCFMLVSPALNKRFDQLHSALLSTSSARCAYCTACTRPPM